MIPKHRAYTKLTLFSKNIGYHLYTAFTDTYFEMALN